METTKFTEILQSQNTANLHPCTDCGVLVRNRVVEFAVYDLSRNPHWKKSCRECGVKTRVSGPIDKPK
jgi:hypothetical protein